MTLKSDKKYSRSTQLNNNVMYVISYIKSDDAVHDP